MNKTNQHFSLVLCNANALIGGDAQPAAATRQYVFAERGAHGSGLPNGAAPFDLNRTIIGQRYKLIYNALWQLPYMPVDFNGAPFWQELRQMNKDGKLSPLHARLYFSPTRPMFELFDLEVDPNEFTNLIGKPEHAAIENELKAKLQEWMILERDYLPLPIPLVNRNMKPSTILPPGFLSLTLILLACGQVVGQSVRRPNVVLIIADDLAWDDTGAYGNRKVRTPNIDRLAREGLKFTRAFVTISSCSPSRSSLITGRYPHSTDAEQLHWPLPAEQVTFVEKLKAAGYRTAASGKWHLGDYVRERFDLVDDPGEAGFQTDPKTGKMLAKDDSGAEGWIPVMRQRPKDKPFFLWLAALDPHRDYVENSIPNPHRPADVIVPPYLPDTPEVRKELALYYDEITRLDSYVGKVLAELEQQGVADNTLVLFISDNGRPFPRAKTTLYDSGIRTPLLARWPSMIRRGGVAEGLVSSVDIAPTILQLAGVEIPPTVQGKSFAATLTNPKAITRDAIYAEKNWHDYEDRARAVRTTRFKFIRNDYPDLPLTTSADSGRSQTMDAIRRLRDAGKLTPEQARIFQVPRPAEELYDIVADPHEFKNLATDPRYARKLAELRDKLNRWGRETDDQMPACRTPDEFDRETGQPLPARQRPRPVKREMKCAPS